MAPCHEQPEGSMKAGRRGYPARSGVGWLLAKCCCCCSCKGRWGPGVRGAVPRGAGAGAGGPCGALGRAASPPPPARSAPGTSGGKGKGQGKADSGRARRPAAGLAERVRPGHPPPPPSPPRLPARREPPRQGAAGPLPGGAGEPATGIGRERAKVDRIHFSFAGRKHPGTVGQ